MYDGATPVTGTIAWETPELVPTVATSTASWIFTPTNGNTYSQVTGTADITVNKSTLSGTPTFTTITSSGKTLGDVGISAEFKNPYTGATVTGTLAWNAGNSETVTANTAYAWTFTPGDTDNYEAVSGSITPYPVGGGTTTPSIPTTRVVVGTQKDGKVTVSNTRPSIGEKVTITVRPDEGFDLNSMVITDRNGKNIEYTDNDDGTFTFTYEGDFVEIKTEFVREDKECDGGYNCTKL